MKYVLNEYNRDITDNELISDLKRVSDELGNIYISNSLYKKYGKYSVSTIVSHFGSWTNALKTADLRTIKNSEEMQRITDDMLIQDVLLLAKKLEANTISTYIYQNYGTFSLPTIIERFETWENFLKCANLKLTGYIGKIPDISLFEEIERIWTKVGKQPTTTMIRQGISKYSLDTYTRRFGGWRNTLKAFINYIDNGTHTISTEVNQDIESIDSKEIKKNNSNKVDDLIFKHKTPRNINLRLRFKVLKRDNFKCCACGTSPAKDPSIELHVDHIVAWVNGGETEINNLQTLCSDCNLGKSDLY